MNQTQKLVIASICVFTQIGCGSGASDAKMATVKARLKVAISGFQNAEENFGPSATQGDLVKNAHWLDRMVAEFRRIEKIEKEGIELGCDSLTDLKTDLAKRFQRCAESFDSDVKYVGVMNQFEIAKIWLEL